ncbi:uncharacterized protein RJT21DRAFT_57970 [Scheffersomyces amazonensis]|uniref:uncharacterized protein n=1 Tax=Scheffersomyces amazonensis TaxID=1078765 RepID=UPI00315CEA04
MSLLYHPISSKSLSQRDITGCLTPTLQSESNTRNTPSTPTTPKMSTNELYQPKVTIPTTSNFYPKSYFTPTPVPNNVESNITNPDVTNGKEKEIQAAAAAVVAATSSTSTSTTILSPPLSPYQRNDVPLNTGGAFSKPIITVEEKSFLKSTNPNQPFKIENFRDYKLTINPYPNSRTTTDYKTYHQNFLNNYSLISSVEASRSYAAPIPVRKYTKRKQQPTTDFSDNDGSGSTFERIRTRRVIKSTRDDSSSDFEELPTSTVTPSSSPAPKKRKVASSPGFRSSNNQSPSIALQQQMLIDESIPDLSPNAFETLPPNNSKALRIEWKGQPMDLSNDPLRNKLHPAELVLASILRLPVAVYLDSKRRFFFEKIERFKQGKQFRRTDAQKACRIDVNKASRLYAAFEKVGWLKDEHFKKYL